MLVWAGFGEPASYLGGVGADLGLGRHAALEYRLTQQQVPLDPRVEVLGRHDHVALLGAVEPAGSQEGAARGNWLDLGDPAGISGLR